MIRFIFAFWAFMFITLSFNPLAQAAKIYRTIQYYSISGKTAEQLDKALARNGPYLKSTGTHHPGVTTITFDPHLKLRQDANSCKVATVNVDVFAKVELPHWKQRSTTKSIKLAVLWDVLSRDIRRHEESHIVIARSHASAIEQAVRSLPARKNCDLLKADIEKISAKILIKHDAAQKQFDKVEAINFETRFIRLLAARVDQLQAELSQQ